MVNLNAIFNASEAEFDFKNWQPYRKDHCLHVADEILALSILVYLILHAKIS